MSPKAKKIIVRGGITLLVLIIIVVLAVPMFAGRAVKLGVETAGSRALNVGVTLENASLAILGADVSLEKLRIQNPEGYTRPNLLELDRGRVETQWSGLLGNPVQIDRIRLDGAVVVLEQKGLKNNLQELLSAIAEQDPQGTQSQGKPLRIQELLINDVKVQAKLLPLPGRAQDVEFTLQPIRMTDLGTDRKLDLAELTARVVVAIAGGIIEQGGDMLPTELIGPMKSILGESGRMLMLSGQEALQRGAEAGKDLVEKGKEMTTEAADKAKEIGEGLKDVGEGLKGLLEKKD